MLDQALKDAMKRLAERELLLADLEPRIAALEVNVSLNKSQCRLRLNDVNSSITNALQAVSDLVNAHDDHLMKPQVTDEEVRRADEIGKSHPTRIILQDFLDRRG